MRGMARWCSFYGTLQWSGLGWMYSSLFVRSFQPRLPFPYRIWHVHKRIIPVPDKVFACHLPQVDSKTCHKFRQCPWHPKTWPWNALNPIQKKSRVFYSCRENSVNCHLEKPLVFHHPTKPDGPSPSARHRGQQGGAGDWETVPGRIHLARGSPWFPGDIGIHHGITGRSTGKFRKMFVGIQLTRYQTWWWHNSNVMSTLD